jgi:integrase
MHACRKHTNDKQFQKSLKTDNYKVAVSKKKKLEYELSIGDLHLASEIPLAVILEVFCKHLIKTRTFKSYKNDFSRLRTFFGPICESLKPYPSGVKRGTKTERTASDKYKKAHVQAELLEDITPEVINQFLTDRMEFNNWKPKTVNLMRQILHKLFAYAMKHHGFRSRDRCYPNPVAGVDRIKESASQIRYLELDEIAAQLEAIEDSSVIHALVATYIYAGLRREEALWLTPADVDLEQRLIRIRAKTVNNEHWQPKTKRNRVVPISSQLYAILINYRWSKDSVWFFPSPNEKRWNPDNFSQDLRKLNNQAGLVWSCLDFRHTFGSQLAQKGESLYKISELMGNSPEICRKHYAALIPERMKDTVEFDVPAALPSNEKDPEIHGMLKEILGKLGGEDDHKPRIRLVR